MVIVAPATEVALSCGGAPMIPAPRHRRLPAPPLPRAAPAARLLGKRYVNAAGDLELLCVKPGEVRWRSDGESAGAEGSQAACRPPTERPARGGPGRNAAAAG